MPRDDWYRRTSWSEQDRADFEARLARSRGSRSEYLRVQAVTLASTRNVETARPALALASQYLRENPDATFAGGAHLTMAVAHTTLGEIEAAIDAYRESIRCQQARPNVRDNAYLGFAWFAATRGLTDLYDEVLDAIEASFDRADLTFPADQYRYFGALALISADLGDAETARSMAEKAIAAAGRKTGPFWRHPQLGLVKEGGDEVRERIDALAG